MQSTSFLRRHGHWLITLFIAFVFIQSLFFKFTGSPETVYIFEGKLDPWAASLGFPGLFAPGGIFSAKVVGAMELIASVLLLVGAWRVKNTPWLQGLGALLSLGVISGAIFFHLFTPLGVAVQNTDGSSDGGTLFIMACLVWLGSAALAIMRKNALLGLIKR
jgi:hypothetical protein